MEPGFLVGNLRFLYVLRRVMSDSSIGHGSFHDLSEDRERFRCPVRGETYREGVVSEVMRDNCSEPLVYRLYGDAGRKRCVCLLLEILPTYLSCVVGSSLPVMLLSL